MGITSVVWPVLRSLPAAYRVDCANRHAPFGQHDDSWLVVGSSLQQAASATNASSRRAHLFDALGTSIDLLGDERIEHWAAMNWPDAPSHLDSVMALIDDIQQQGALRIAAVMLDDLLLAVHDAPPVMRGRILALRARVEWKLGGLDEATERYEFIAALGRKYRLPELKARADLGLGTIAQLRGNFPAMVRLLKPVATLADAKGWPILARTAHLGLMVAAAKNTRFGSGLIHGWRVYELSMGDEGLEGEALQSLGQLLLEAGHPHEARAAFAAIVERKVAPRVLLAGLGGLALASARSGIEPTVEWAVREIWNATARSAPMHELAGALIEAAIALGELGRHEESQRFRDQGRRIAVQGQFHELVFAADKPATAEVAPKPEPLRPRAAGVAERVSSLEPAQLPSRLYLGTVATEH